MGFFEGIKDGKIIKPDSKDKSEKPDAIIFDETVADDFSKQAGTRVKVADSNGAVLSEAFVEAAAHQNGGVIFVEGRKVAEAGSAHPINVAIRSKETGEIVADSYLWMSVSHVGDMIRHVTENPGQSQIERIPTPYSAMPGFHRRNGRLDS